jgi:ubiquinone/menaquinone biosynthesis C-methylase UbiE
MLAAVYDPLVWVLTTGRASRLRQATLAAARIGPGDDVLDVGCATGPLTAAARVVVGGDARVAGVDSSEPMLARARRRTARAGTEIEFLSGQVEQLPFPDGSFDVVMLSLVLHYLPPEGMARALAEARRVLRCGGRIVVVDFARTATPGGRLRAHVMLHGAAAATAPDPGELLMAAGFGEVGPAPCPLTALTIAQGVRDGRA